MRHEYEPSFVRAADRDVRARFADSRALAGANHVGMPSQVRSVAKGRLRMPEVPQPSYRRTEVARISVSFVFASFLTSYLTS
jgi:hypothetical protein